MPSQHNQTPLRALLGLLTTSIHTIEAELDAARMPTFTLDPKWHPLDSPNAVPTPKLHEARKVAMASAHMIQALVQDVGTALMEMSMRMLDTSAYILTADIGVVDVFKTDEEKLGGLHVSEMVARLPDGKKVNPQKLARCLRLLAASHWWTEPSPDVFAPTRWAFLNITGSPTWAFANPVSSATLMACTALTEYMTDPTMFHADTIDASPFSLALRKTGSHRENFWEWCRSDQGRMRTFTHSMEGFGYTNIAALKVDYPWDALPSNTTLVDVGGGLGSVSLHVLRHVYTKVPTLKVVCQDLDGPIAVGRKYWEEEFPEALTDGRVEFETHDFFTENPRKDSNTVYFMRYILHDWQDSDAVTILRQIRASCHVSSRVLIADSMILPAIPSKQGDFGGMGTFEESLSSINNDSPYRPMGAPYPISQNFGFATKVQNSHDVMMLHLLNALERTREQFEKILWDSGFKINQVFSVRSTGIGIESFTDLGFHREK